MINESCTQLTNNELSLLQNNFKFIDKFILEFCRVQSDKLKNNLSSASFNHTLNRTNVFKNIQKLYYDELTILLTGWGKLYNFKSIAENEKIKNLIFATKESSDDNFNFFDVVDSLILSGCPAILIKDESDINQVINKIKTVKLIGQIFNINISVFVKINEEFDIFNRCISYSNLADVIWIDMPTFDKNLSIKLKKDIPHQYSQKILGYKYNSFDENVNKILSSLGYMFSDIEPGWIPTVKLEFT